MNKNKKTWTCPACGTTKNPLYVEYFPACVTYQADFNENGAPEAGNLESIESTVLDMYKEVYLRCSECDYEEGVQ